MSGYLVKPHTCNSPEKDVHPPLGNITNTEQSSCKEEIKKRLTVSPEVQRLIEMKTKEQSCGTLDEILDLHGCKCMLKFMTNMEHFIY